ncbi:MAG: hypothetical protein COV57_00690 [Candidatus Liptonbacteria bacterium CG11_big_fil_rev_8_21_14_0_20_35_14]|uniref:Thioredoxin domain-containing protein n=1 Tax=Candidatus Liptonbacteria bacterium CG11_big_fil_rev_8_21_14_0_20_35_14 TaxID=1974634 RepID=A0A2H0N8C4_9BACT|nr:MAG: hypothetical protein COV57_00690 [Candidatus Liptonbacteria bacterium CG11_big_fil_rev_8_21_14_0_20_35_14]
MNTENNNYSISGAIILAAIIIAGAVIFVGSNKINNSDNTKNNNNTPPENNISIREVSLNEHIKGNPNAPITIVEYSDFECPYCASLHPTLEQIVTSDYKDEVRWVYRHFPLTNIHSNARPSAIASECVAKLAGNDAFWQFVDNLFSNQTNLNPSLYESLALDLGIDKENFNSCLSDTDIKNIVDQDLAEVTKAGGQGTPFSIIIDKNGNKTVVPGAVPFETWQQIIDSVK